MLNLTMLSPEAYQANNKIVHLESTDINFLDEAILKSSRKRSRILSHRSSEENLHEMFVIYNNETFIRPNKHLGKDESIFILKGSCDFFFFDDDGNVTKCIEMGEEGSGKPFYLRVPKNIFHTLIIKSPEIVLFEGTPGPFDPTDTVYADWGPLEEDFEEIELYKEFLNNHLRKDNLVHSNTNLISFKSLNDLVVSATDQFVSFSENEKEFIKKTLIEKDYDRFRICAHKDSDDKLHEMLMVFSSKTYVRPSLHIDKEESLYILDGFGTYVFYDEQGKVIDHVKLGPKGSGRSFYCRIPANTYHSLIVESDQIIVKETTSGPFNRSDTLFATWSPEENDQLGIEKFINILKNEIL